MKFLLDENVSETLSQSLRDAGFSVIHVSEVGLESALDEEIISFARKNKLIIITHDKDFGNLIRFPLQIHYGVILLRFRNQRPSNVFPYLFEFLKQARNLKSRLVILREDGFRII